MGADPLAALPKPGDIVAGKYRIERLIGQGGMGAVFAAQHLSLCRPVAIKVLLAELAGSVEALARFQTEARNSARLQNDHVARVADVGTDGALAYMELELLEGEDLAQLLERRGRLPYDEAVGYVLQGLEGVQHAHAMEIVHRDLKPSNLFLARRPDGSSIVKILDFGISKAKNPLDQPAGALTSTKAMLGSPLYMSPEQLRSSKTVDAKADIWALGVILHELITGSVPFLGENLGELFAAILEQSPADISTRVPGVPPELGAIVMRCLQRSIDHRFQSALELSLALRPFAASASGPFSAGTAAMHHPMAGFGSGSVPVAPHAATAPPMHGAQRSSSPAFPPHSAVASTTGPQLLNTPAPTLPLHAMSPMTPLHGGAATGGPVSMPRPGVGAETGYQVPKRSGAGLFIIAAAGLLTLGVVGGGIFAYANRPAAHPPEPSPSASASVADPPPPPSASVAATPASAAPSAGQGASPAASVAAGKPVPVKPGPGSAIKTRPKPLPVAVAPKPPPAVAPAPPTPEPPKPVVVAPKQPPPKPKPTSTIQTSR